MKVLLAIGITLLVDSACLATEQSAPDALTADIASMVNKFICSGVELQQQKLYDLAIQNYSAALKLDRTNFIGVFDRATAEQQKGDFDSAISDYRLAISLQPENRTLQDALKNVLAAKAYPFIVDGAKKLDAKDYAGAVAAYKASLAINDDQSVHVHLGLALIKLGRFDEASQELDKGGCKFDCDFRMGDFLDADGKTFFKPGS